MKTINFWLCLVVALACVRCDVKGAPPTQGQTNQGSTNPNPSPYPNTNPNPNPVPTTCQPSEVLYQNQCYAQYIPCTAGGGTGQKEFFNGVYGSCVVNSCPTNTHLESGTCQSNIKACAIANGTGQQQWSGSGYGACTLVTCNNEYLKEGNACTGPIVNLYRYRHAPSANYPTLYNHWFSINANDTTVPGAIGQGIKLILFKNQVAGSVPLLQCDLKASTGYFIFYQNTQCEYGGTPAVLGYMPAAPQGSANKAIYYCPMGSSHYGITTTNTAEMGICTGTVIGYSF